MNVRILAAVTLFSILAAPAFAKGVCSTGGYKSCVECCKSGVAGVTNPKLCAQQCADYLPLRERIRRLQQELKRQGG